MELFVSAIVGALVGVGFSVWRLRGSRTVSQAVRVVILGGGGPGEE